MPLLFVENDIARMRTDAVVNAANEGLYAGGGVCGAIFRAAGAQQLQQACDAIGHCPTGQAVATPGFGLAARHIIHAVGPLWRGGGHGEEALLRSAYRNALELARELGCTSVSFPLISAGIYGYPQAEALAVATDEIGRFLGERANAGGDAHAPGELTVYLVMRSRGLFAFSLEGYADVAALVSRSCIDEDDAAASAAAAEEELQASEAPAFGAPASAAGLEPSAAPEPGAAPAYGAEAAAAPKHAHAASWAPAPAAAQMAAARPAPIERGELDGLLDALDTLDASFARTVLALIDERGLTDVEVYKRANLSRQVFSKLRRDDGYRPTKQTAVALAVALRLDLKQTQELLARAGYALGRASKFDVIVAYYIEHNRYNVLELNEMLFAFDQPLLGSA